MANSGPDTSAIYQIRVDLREIRPPIWRRFLVTRDIRLDQLHLVLQAVIGWDNYHLYQFRIKDLDYGEPFEDEDIEMHDAAKTLLSQVIGGAEEMFVYDYDFGDGWEHDLRVEKTLPTEPGTEYPVCTAGRRACPPEDCGGPFGYADFLDALKDPAHENHEMCKEWMDGEFNPETFDPAEANRTLESIR